MVNPENKKTVVNAVHLSDDVVLHALSLAYRSYTLFCSLGISCSFEDVALEYFKLCGVDFVMKKDLFDSIRK